MQTKDQHTLKQQLVSLYKDFIRKTRNEDENYKWDAIEHFRKHWNPDAENFGEMFVEAFRKHTNLFYHDAVWFYRTIGELWPKKAKELFLNLYDESGDIKQRIKHFQSQSDRLLAEIKSETGRENLQHAQDERTLSVYLAFRYPEKYFLYKSSFYKQYCDYLGIKSKTAGQKFFHFTELAEDLKKNYLKKDQELLDLHQKIHPNLSWDDTNLIVQNLIYRMMYQMKMDREELNKAAEPEAGQEKNEKKYWLYSPGPNARHWDEFFDAGIMALGWDDLGDLTKYDSKEEIAEKLRELDNSEGSKKNDATANFEFRTGISPGDYIIAKKGRSEYLGLGIVASDYYFDPERPYYKSCRKVDWQKKGKWQDEHNQVAVKTLTEITPYKDDINRILKLMQEKVEVPEVEYTFNKDVNYYWLNANPKQWTLDKLENVPEIDYTTHTERGTKRRVYKYMQDVRPGDRVIGYETTPVKKVKAILEITRPVYENEEGEEVFDMKLVDFTPLQPTWDELKELEELKNSEVFSNNQGSLFRLTQKEYDAIIALTNTRPDYEPYGKKDLLDEVFIDENKLNRSLSLLRRKKNLILQGPPGTGKTFFAKRLAWCLMGETDPNRVKTIQFHQSYAYEDFIQGYRPENGGLVLKNGVFYEFAKQASRDPGRDYVMIIDEINRGNLSKIFGELMLLIEADKRNEKIQLAYARDSEEAFSVPDNLYIIGTMNTADRSLAMVDYALRRRFAFITMAPHFGERFFENLKNTGFDESMIRNLTSKLDQINQIISGDPALGPGFMVGHSYFVTPGMPEAPEEWLSDILNFEILPLLEEYWFDNNDRIERAREILQIKS